MRIFIILLIVFFATFSYASETESTVGVGEFMKFAWTPNHPNDDVKGYRIYVRKDGEEYIKGKDKAVLNEDILIDANICERTEVVFEGDCISPPIAESVEGDYYYVVTAVDNHEYESDFSNELLIHVIEVKIKNLTIEYSIEYSTGAEY